MVSPQSSIIRMLNQTSGQQRKRMGTDERRRMGGEKRKRMGVDQWWSKRMGGGDIDNLPDDLLLNILGRLKFIEAAITTLVSHRLLNFWTFSTHLDFTNEEYHHDQPSLSGTDFMKFVSFILNRHQGNSVDYLKIAFDAVGIGENDFDVQGSLEKWVEFARSKGVRSLEFDLHNSVPLGSPANGDSPFCFPLHELYGLKTLTSLSLKYVSILDDDDIVYLLESSLVNLETLVIENAPCLQNLKIVAQKLKHLKIRHCPELCSIDIVSAPNLLSFEKAGDYRSIVRVSFCRNVLPKLLNVYLGGLLCQNVLSELQEIAPCLEKLEVDMDRICQEPRRSFPHLGNIKQLVINFGVDIDLTFIIDVCPNLQDLTLKYVIHGHIHPTNDRTQHWPKPSSHHTHKSLRKVTFVGWSGKKDELQLAIHLMKIATNLQMVIFDTNPSDPQLFNRKGKGYRRTGYREWLCDGAAAIWPKHYMWMESLSKVQKLVGSKPGSVAFRYALPRTVLKDPEVYEDWQDQCWTKHEVCWWRKM